MATCLIAYDEFGRVVATLSGVWEGNTWVDLETAEASGIRLRSYWNVSGAVGSGTWPEALTGAPDRYRVDLDSAQPLRIRALIDVETGARTERTAGSTEPAVP